MDGNVCVYFVNLFYCIYIQYAYGIDELYFNLLLFFKVYGSLVKEEIDHLYLLQWNLKFEDKKVHWTFIHTLDYILLPMKYIKYWTYKPS